MSQMKEAFGQRLKQLRKDLGYTQQELAYALGIQWSRYHKYELGINEPPFEILVKLANFADVDLDYLIAGQEGRRGRKAEPPWGQVRDLLNVVPTAALIYDRYDRLVDCNRRYRDLFFPNASRVAKPGTSLDVLARVWSNNHGIDPEEIEAYVEKRKNRKLFRKSPVELRVGPKTLQFAETINPDFRFVQIIDVSELRSLS